MSASDPKRALITGAGGFVGANLARRLLRDGHAVVCLVRPGSDRWRLEPISAQAQVLEADLTDPVATSEVVGGHRPQWVFHLAAHGAYSWQRDRSRIFATNLDGSISLADACAAEPACEVLVHAGSSSEYGYKDHAPGEDEATVPNSDYAVAKAAATMYLRLVARRSALRTVTLRLYSVFGPWEDPGRFVPTLAREGLKGSLPDLVGPDTARDFVYVDDVCEAFVLAAGHEPEEPGPVFNVGTGVQTTIREAVDLAIDRFGIRAEPTFDSMEARSWDTGTWVADPRRILAALGWKPALDFAAGFDRFVDWLRAEPAAGARYGVAPS